MKQTESNERRNGDKVSSALKTPADQLRSLKKINLRNPILRFLISIRIREIEKLPEMKRRMFSYRQSDQSQFLSNLVNKHIPFSSVPSGPSRAFRYQLAEALSQNLIQPHKLALWPIVGKQVK